MVSLINFNKTMKKLINLFVVALLVSFAMSCSDDKSTSPNDEDDGTGSNGPGEVVLYTEIEYSLNSSDDPEIITYDQEIHSESEFSSYGSYKKSDERLVWNMSSEVSGKPELAFDIVLPIDEIAKKQYSWGNGDDTILEGSSVYLSGRYNQPVQIVKSDITIDSHFEKEIDSRDYSIISGTAIFHLNVSFSETSQAIMTLDFKHLKVELFE